MIFGDFALYIQTVRYCAELPFCQSCLLVLSSLSSPRSSLTVYYVYQWPMDRVIYYDGPQVMKLNIQLS